MSPDSADLEAFVRANTVIEAPPLVPEIRLHLAAEVTPIWQATEDYLQREGIEPPFWAFAWPGSQAVARYVLDHPEVVRGKKVLDFAAGGGLAAIAAKKAGALQVTANEIDPLAGACLSLNAALNGVELQIEITDLVTVPDTEEPLHSRPIHAWNVILAGDICYERSMAERLTVWLRSLAREGATVLLADPGRAYQPTQKRIDLARYTVPTSTDLEDSDSRETVLYRLLP